MNIKDKILQRLEESKVVKFMGSVDGGSIVQGTYTVQVLKPNEKIKEVGQIRHIQASVAKMKKLGIPVDASEEMRYGTTAVVTVKVPVKGEEVTAKFSVYQSGPAEGAKTKVSIRPVDKECESSNPYLHLAGALI